MNASGAVVVALTFVATWLATPGAGGASRLRRWRVESVQTAGPFSVGASKTLLSQRIRRSRGSGPGDDAGSALAAELAERAAALVRAGLPPSRLWWVLAGEPQGAGRAPVAGGTFARTGTRIEQGSGTAIERVAGSVAAVVELGGSEAQGLRRAATDLPALRLVALACDLSRASGAPQGDVLDGIARSMRAQAQAERERRTVLAGPRLTARLLAWLPLGGVGLGLLTGSDGVRILVSTPVGWACAGVAIGLWALGRWWMTVLLRRAERAGAGL